MDLFLIFPLLERLKDIRYIESLSLKRSIQVLNNHSQQIEWENAKQWYSMEKSKKEGEMKKDGHIAVNQKEVLEDYFEKRQINHPLSIAITGISNREESKD